MTAAAIPESLLAHLQHLARELEAALEPAAASRAGVRRSEPWAQELIEVARDAYTALTSELVQAGELYPLVPPQAVQEQARRLVEFPVFIGGKAKSGTTLMRNMLDGHPQVMMIPVDSKAGYEKIVQFQRQTGELWNIDMRRILTEKLITPQGFSGPRWILGAAGDVEPYLSFSRYQAYWRRQFPETVDSVMRANACAFYCTLPAGQGSQLQYWAEKSTRNVDHAQKLGALFPDARFVHIVRHPAAVVASQKGKNAIKQKPFDLLTKITGLRQAMTLARDNQARLGPDRYHIVLYEQLIAQPEQVMRAVADFLQIPFDEILTRPTVHGRPATANTAYRSSMPEPGQLAADRIEKWKEVLTTAEIEIVDYYLGDRMRDFGYRPGPKASPAGHLWNLVRASRQYARESALAGVEVRVGWFWRLRRSLSRHLRPGSL